MQKAHGKQAKPDFWSIKRINDLRDVNNLRYIGVK